MEIRIKDIDHNLHRYPTVGDYFYDSEGVLQIRVSTMKSHRHMILVAIHELCEQFITECNGITEDSITDFDMVFEKGRELGLRTPDEEPGFSDEAPYRFAHYQSTAVELMLCAATGTSWKEYEREVLSL